MSDPRRMFSLRLALAMGRVDVDVMLDGIEERQLMEWMAYDRLQPFGDDRADLRSALAASAFCNSMGAKTKPLDFMPFAGPGAEQDAEQQIATARTIASAAGARPGVS